MISLFPLSVLAVFKATGVHASGSIDFFENTNLGGQRHSCTTSFRSQVCYNLLGFEGITSSVQWAGLDQNSSNSKIGFFIDSDCQGAVRIWPAVDERQLADLELGTSDRHVSSFIIWDSGKDVASIETLQCSLMTMPMLIVNMGAEMIYVLDQRLKAQSIPREKSSKVLEDIVKTMHNETFMAELFKPHRMYSNVSTRQIFDRLAHSSIMRLNATSMDKLYDLMRMGFKYQVLSCSSPDELLQVTMNHLMNTKNLIDSPDVKRQVDETILLTSTNFSGMNPAEFFMLKQYLCRFFQDTRIKVSLFLQNGIQGTDGTLAIHYEGFTATGGKVPGTTRYFNASGNIEEEETFAIDSAEGSVEAPEGSVLNRTQLNSHLGFNMYEADSKDGTGGFSRSTRQLFADSKLRGAGSSAKGLDTHKHQKQFKATAEDGFNLLADLVGKSASAKDVEGDNKALRINLFPDDPTKEGPYGDDEDEKEVPTIWIDAASDRKTSTDAILQDFKLDDDGAKREGKAGDDLLDLMDSTN